MDVPRDGGGDVGTDVVVALDVQPDVTNSDVPADVRADVPADVPVSRDACGSTVDPSAIGARCTAGGGECPAGYTCHPFSGFALMYSCEILCASSCDCPTGTTCQVRSDKAGSWMQCSP
jgi:hypothetical protein